MNEEPLPVVRDLPMLRRRVWDELGDVDVEIPLTYELFPSLLVVSFFPEADMNTVIHHYQPTGGRRN